MGVALRTRTRNTFYQDKLEPRPRQNPKYPQPKTRNFWRFRKGVGGRGLATNKPLKRGQKVLQKCVPILPRGHRKKGTEKSPESLVFEGFLRANPPLSANPFSKLLKFHGMEVVLQKDPETPRCPQNWSSHFRPQNCEREILRT